MRNQIKKKDIQVEKQYKEYLKRVNLDEGTMNPIQRIETRNAFFAGFGSAMVIMSHGIGMMKTDQDKFETSAALLKEVGDHFERATERHDAKLN